MAYDVYWTGYDFSMDIEALQALGIPKVRQLLSQPWLEHGVWKSLKKSHSTLRAKRAMFTFGVDVSSVKNAKMV